MIQGRGMSWRRTLRRVVLLLAAAPVLATAAWGEDGAGYRRTVVRYELPDVALVDQDGARVRLQQALTADKPVMLNFFFSTCTTICPVLSAGVTTLLKNLGAQASEVRVVSIAIDPDHDTPEVLRAYRKRFGAVPEWELLTGSREDIDRVLKAFDAYSPDKTAHRPLHFLRPAGGDSWVRIDGLIGASDLMAEYRGLRRP
jgi:protein SCO1/2